MDSNARNHWEAVYETKTADQVSWTQQVPKTSLEFIHSFNLPRTAKIIDVGGGDSRLVDFLLAEGFENITVLDISSKALEKAKQRLGEQAGKVNWIVSDIMEFEPDTNFDIWHDRATFHFLTSKEQIDKYVATVTNAVTGYLIVGTFSDNGPKKCSGLTIQQYNEETLPIAFRKFEKISCITEDHLTPFNTTQNFVFCSFRKH